MKVRKNEKRGEGAPTPCLCGDKLVALNGVVGKNICEGGGKTGRRVERWSLMVVENI